MKPTLGLYEKAMPDSLSWQEKLKAAQAAGFDALELSIDESDARLARLSWTKRERMELLKLTRQTGLYIDTMCLSGHRKYPLGSGEKETEQKSLEMMEKAIELAYDIGVRIIQLAGYDVYYNEISSVQTRERFLQNLYKSTRLAASRGVILALETMENDFCNTVEKAMYFVKSVDSPYLQIYPDVGNLSNAQQEVTGDIKKGRGHIAAAHLKETVPGVFRNMKFGQGKVDFPLLIHALKEQGVSRFTAEFWYDGQEDWELQLQKAHDFLRPLLNEEV